MFKKYHHTRGRTNAEVIIQGRALYCDSSETLEQASVGRNYKEFKN
jgi:hypothetical protein